MTENPNAVWDKSLLLIKENVSEQQFNTWFKPIVFEKFDEKTRTLLLQVPSPFVYEYLEENFIDLLGKVLTKNFGAYGFLIVSLQTRLIIWLRFCLLILLRESTKRK